jgi:hypothetical protein
MNTYLLDAVKVVVVVVTSWLTLAVFGFLFGTLVGSHEQASCSRYTIGQLTVPLKIGYCVATTEVIGD